jgi:hypothetical protein
MFRLYKMRKNKNITILISGIIIFFFSCESNVKLKNPIIGHSKVIGQLEVAEQDLPDSLNWQMAINSCGELGDGWRAPTKDELELIYKNKDSIGGFTKLFYWTSSESDTCCAWCYSFYNGYGVKYCNKENYGYVRPVKTIN